MSGIQTPITIDEAMRHIANNVYVLPSFQRDFLWDMERIERLFDSLMREYPTNTMLFWKIDGDKRPNWKFYKFLNSYVSGARNYTSTNEPYEHTGTNDYFAVLDGQQRLTAIRIGLFGTYAVHERKKSLDFNSSSFPPQRLYLRLREHVGSEYESKYVFEFKKDTETDQKTLFTDTRGELWFRVGAIVDIHNTDDGLDEYCDEQGFEREQKRILRRLEKIIFSVPCITYYREDEQNPDKAVNIFTRINSGGITLNFSDLIFAIMVANWKKTDIKKESTSLISGVAGMGFSIDKDFIVKAFLYLYHKNIKTEISNFTIDFCDKIEQAWPKISDAILSLFSLLRSFGLNEATLTSTNAVLPILYYIYHKDIYTDLKDKIAYKDERESIKKWLLSVLVRRAFGSHTDGVLSQTRRVFTENIEAEYIKSELAEFPSEALCGAMKSLRDINDEFLDELLSTQKDNKYAFSILALLYPNLDYKNNNFHKDHLHPESHYDWLDEDTRKKVPFEVYNSIVNLQMLDASENMSKNDKPLEEWISSLELSEIEEKHFLEAHLIPLHLSLRLDNVDLFLRARRVLLKEKLKAILS
ncbi:MAG: DUF262 domain-containing protein [Clostridia bacterium]|nr:DUF262 domain-containing protein [Clostridia bacterium]